MTTVASRGARLVPAFFCVVLQTAAAWPQAIATPEATPAEAVDLAATTWIYRSFRSTPELSVPTRPLSELLFGQGELELSVDPDGALSGTLGGPGWQLSLAGKAEKGTPATLRFRGTGSVGGEAWAYEYIGYVVPAWPNGIDQRRAIVGTVIRSAPHSGGQAPAGYVAQWIAVERGGPAAHADDAAPAGAAGATYRKHLGQLYLEDEREKADAAGEGGAGAAAPEPLSRAANPTAVAPAAPGRPGEIELVVDYATVRIGNDDVRLRTYNGSPVGPVIRAKAGDTVYITLRNKLPVEPPVGHGTNTHHEWNTTNLHFHGLHVAPQGPSGSPDEESDNVLLELAPTTVPGGSVQRYAVRIPANHVAGTFWYHAHRHGSTAGQVASGMCGALIIERTDDVHNLDSVREVADAREEIMVLQQIPYLKPAGSTTGFVERSSDGSLNNDWALQMLSPTRWRDLRRYVTVNGQRIPTITLAPGEVRRLRLVHSGQRERITLEIERDAGTPGGGDDTFPFHEIAADGLPLGDIRETPSLVLYPGYRSDVLIQPAGSTTGTFYLVDRDAADGTGADGSPEPLRRVARIVVAGPPRTMNLPSRTQLAPHRLPDLATPVTGTQYAFYGVVLVSGAARFFITDADLSAGGVPAGREFGPANVRELTEGRTERWIVGARNGNGITAFHPFHIHTNPFLVEEVRDGSGADVTTREVGGPTWRDTLAMKQGFTYRLLTRYDDFTGDFVHHCHILDHEDNGMMERVRIVPDTSPAPAAPSTAARPDDGVPPASAGVPSVLFFVQGSFCPHCMAQLSTTAKQLHDRGLRVEVVSAASEDDLESFPELPFRLVADPDLKLFKQYGAYDGEAKHATIALDRSGREVFRKVGNEPFMDAGAVIASLGAAAPRFVVAVRNTDGAEDDYLTWAPTRCQIRMEGGTLGGPDALVVLSNDDPALNPDGGDVRFARTLSPGATADQTTLSLAVRQDGTPTDFYIAGIKASRLTAGSLTDGGRDAVIDIHAGGPAGPLLGSAAVMVRVRKDISAMTPLEINEFLRAVADLHMVENRYEWYVRMHRLATGHPTWPDQAHLGPAFIAWHRAFLLQFERELQQKFPHVALPYWAQGTPQTFFSADEFGENTAGGPEEVRFNRPNLLARTGSPLWGWAISLDHDPTPGTPNPMGPLRRSARDHNAVSTPTFYQRWGTRLESLPNFRDAFPNRWGDGVLNAANTNFNVEANPHNNGHGRVGPPSTWMQNCRESNADPVFWVFHCNHDYLWAKWQRHHDRFDNRRNHPEHYWPSDAFTDSSADRNIPRGHHLDDPMWPWDGSTSMTYPGQRPTSNGFGDFPEAAFADLWPAMPAQPKPADVIDYMNVTGRGGDLGFCYDDVDYGRASQPAAPLSVAAAGGGQTGSPDTLKAEMFQNEAVSPDLRLSAARQLDAGDRQPTAATLRAIATDSESAAEVRGEALRRLAATAPGDAVDVAEQILADVDSSSSLSVAALDQLAQMLHFSSLRHDEAERILRVAAGAVTEAAAPAARAAALRLLAPGGNAVAEERLVAGLTDAGGAVVSDAEAIALLRFYPARRTLIRGRLDAPNEEVALAAVRSLHRDADSAADRRRVAADRARGADLRKAAVQSVMHDDAPESTETLFAIAGDTSDDLDVRAEALAALRVRFQRASKTLPADRKADWSEKVAAIETGSADSSELGALKRDALDALGAAVP